MTSPDYSDFPFIKLGLFWAVVALLFELQHTPTISVEEARSCARDAIDALDNKDYDKVIDCCSKVIQFDSRNAAAYNNRGIAYTHKCNFNAALCDFNKAVELDPANANWHNSLACLLATCPAKDIRDGKRAIEHAARACELTACSDYLYLSTLAAAYAAAGDFEKAIAWQTKAIETAPEMHNAEYRSNLELYERQTPYIATYECT